MKEKKANNRQIFKVLEEINNKLINQDKKFCFIESKVESILDKLNIIDKKLNYSDKKIDYKYDRIEQKILLVIREIMSALGKYKNI